MSTSSAGREIYLRLTNGAADTKLTNAYFDSEALHREHRQKLADRDQAARS